jgi:hypothetical protein
MPTTRTRLLVCTAVAVTAFVRLGVAPTYKPIEQRQLTTAAPAGPVSFDGLWRLSSAVVEGIVEKVDAVEPARSRVTVRLVEIYRDDARVSAPGGELQVFMAGALTDRGAYIEAVEDPSAPLLRRNQRAILFLRRAGLARTFDLATGSHDSLYLIDGAAVASHGHSALARRLAEQSHGEFAALLRAMRGAGR